MAPVLLARAVRSCSSDTLENKVGHRKRVYSSHRSYFVFYEDWFADLLMRASLRKIMARIEAGGWRAGYGGVGPNGGRACSNASL